MDKDTEWGQISVHDDVLAALAGAAAIATPGVVGLITRHHAEDDAPKMVQEQLAKGVTITQDSWGMTIDISLTVRYGVKIKDVGLAVIGAVERVIVEAVAISPRRIAIHIEGVRK